MEEFWFLGNFVKTINCKWLYKGWFKSKIYNSTFLKGFRLAVSFSFFHSTFLSLSLSFNSSFTIHWVSLLRSRLSLILWWYSSILTWLTYSGWFCFYWSSESSKHLYWLAKTYPSLRVKLISGFFLVILKFQRYFYIKGIVPYFQRKALSVEYI